jgi:hypothetical protein
MKDKKEITDETIEKNVEVKKEKDIEEKDDPKDGGKFIKKDEEIDVNRFNQALRKAREAEAEKLEIEKERKRLEELVKKQKMVKTFQKTEENDEDDDESDDFWEEEPKKHKKNVEEKTEDLEKISSIIDEKIRPFVESESQRKSIEKKKARREFYEAHPEYLNDADKWAELLDELNSSILPSGDYYTDLEKAHRIVGGVDFSKTQIENKERELANEAGGGGGAEKHIIQKESKLTEDDKDLMEKAGVSAETIEKMKQKVKEGSLSLEY